MLSLKHRAISMKTIRNILAIALAANLASCGQIDLARGIGNFSLPESLAFDSYDSSLIEVAPPATVQRLNEKEAQYQPKVKITRPTAGTTLQETNVDLELELDNFVLQGDSSSLGNHLSLILDNEPQQEIYRLDRPIVIKDLKPGTHTIRVLAEKPWHESFKNPEAIAYVTFNVLTATEENQPSLDLPLLTYNQPRGSYSAEPILLDFYLSGVKTQDDWRVRATINDDSFIIDELQSVYLKGFKEGNNLVELELLNKDGKGIENAFNKTIALFTLDSQGSQNTLARLMSDRATDAEALAIVGEPIETVETPVEESAVEEVEIIEPPIEEPTTSEATKEEPIVSQSEATELEPEATSRSESTQSSEAVIPTDSVTVVADDEGLEVIVPEEAIAEIIDKEDSEPTVTEVPEVVTQPTSEDNISTTTATPQPSTTAIEPSLEVPVSIPEEIAAVQTAEDVVTESESNTITIEIPKPKKLKVPQWWKNMVANLQKIFSKIQET